MRIQSGRLCRLEFYNLITKKKFTIDQSLRISFEFLKSADETTSQSTGRILIHGLTEATAVALGDRIQGGDKFSTEVKCSVGYSGDKSNFQPLFYAAVMSNKYTKQKGTSTTEIVVSGNHRSFYLGDIISQSSQNTTLEAILSSIVHFPELDWFEFRIGDDIAEDIKQNFINAVFTTRVINWTFDGTLGEFLEKIKKTFYINYSTERSEFGKVSVKLFIAPEAIPFYIKLTYDKIQGVGGAIVGDWVKKEPSKIQGLYEDKDSKSAIVIGNGTGLLSTPYVDNRNVKVPYNGAIQSNDTVVEKKEQKVLKDKEGKAKLDKEGKVKYSKQAKLMTVNRRFVSCKAQLNPSIKPHSMIKILTGSERVDGVYRVRHCKFTGDTHQGDWMVEMELEDTSDSRPEVKKVALAGEDDVEVLS